MSTEGTTKEINENWKGLQVMSKYYTITYKTAGNKTDWVMIWANSVQNAITKFTQLWDSLYNESAIIKIQS